MAPDDSSERHDGISAWWAVREVDYLFARIGHYTRFVAYSKWSLVGVAAVLTLSLIAWPLLSKDKSGLRVSFVDAKTVRRKPDSPVMDNPEYRGIGDKGQQYKITGKTAIQQTPTLVIIANVEGQMLKGNGGWNSLTADRAEYQQDKKLIDLFGNVTVIDDRGNTFTTSHATIEMPSMHVFGNDVITGEGTLGNILASGFEIKDKGEHIIFTGGTQQLKVQVERAHKK